MEKIKVKWLGHSCFSISYKDYTVICDPYEDGSVPGLGNIREKADAVYCSHEHHDHNYRDGVKLSGREDSAFSVTELRSFHDDVKGEMRGKNVIRIFEADGIRVAHFGDLGCELTAEQIAALDGIDCALIPIGGFYTIDAENALKTITAINAKVVVPMHYRGEGFGFDVISDIQPYLDICGRWINTGSSEIEIGHEERHYTAILKPAMIVK